MLVTEPSTRKWWHLGPRAACCWEDGSICCVFGRAAGPDLVPGAGRQHTWCPKATASQSKRASGVGNEQPETSGRGCDVLVPGMAKSCKLTGRSLLKVVLKQTVGDDELYFHAVVSYYVLESLT